MRHHYLDTNACIDYLRGESAELSRRLLAVAPSSVKIASIVEAELRLGAAKSRDPVRATAVVDAFLAPYEVVPFCTRAAKTYAEVRADLEHRGQPIGPNDLVLCATVLVQKGVLVTHNTREFDRVTGLVVEDWTLAESPRRGKRR